MGQMCMTGEKSQHFGLFVVGGCLGALSCAREAA